MKKATVIVGAGASFDVSNDSRALNRDAITFRPPLARYLFSAEFWSIRERYRGAKVLGSELGASRVTDSGAFDLEAKLTEIARHSDKRVRRLFLDVPPYLRDLLLHCENFHREAPANYINLVRWLLEDQTHEIMFVVLNYDTLLESALTLFDPTVTFRSIPSYVEHSRQAKVVKIHGSVNWGIRIPDSVTQHALRNYNRILDEFDPTRAEPDAVELNDTREDSRSWRVGSSPTATFLYPKLTAPLRGKEFVCPTPHTVAFRDFVSDCHQFLVIGTSGLDEDLLQELDTLCESGNCALTYVGPNQEAVASTRERFEAGVRAFRGSAVQPQLKTDGFGGFASSKEGTASFLGRG